MLSTAACNNDSSSPEEALGLVRDDWWKLWLDEGGEFDSESESDWFSEFDGDGLNAAAVGELMYSCLTKETKLCK